MVETVLTDADFMARALQLAERGRGHTSPNPLVGAVVVTPQGVVVGQGYHERAGEAHAEIHAIEAAGPATHGATLYCTLEPCSHFGRTGPCVHRIVTAGIVRVVASVRDPNPVVSGRGFEYLRAHGVRVEIGVGAEQAIRLNRPYLTFVSHERPFVIMKAAVSQDGYVAAAAGTRTRLTSDESLRHAHIVRAEVDGIGVGSTTVLVDDPELTVRGVHRARPFTRVIFDRRLRTPASARVLSTLSQGPVIILTSAQAMANSPDQVDALRHVGATVQAMESADVTAALRWLGSAQMMALVLEGGPTLQSAAWQAGVVDCVHLYVAPLKLGSAGVKWLPTGILSTLVETREEQLGTDKFTEGYVHRTY
jgi:diaminohydroxyphosphoribosylaminopyrimidine deaminase / 5-amino-6-(5-phosphoribosylamino)uracil reductase